MGELAGDKLVGHAVGAEPGKVIQYTVLFSP